MKIPKLQRIRRISGAELPSCQDDLHTNQTGNKAGEVAQLKKTTLLIFFFFNSNQVFQITKQQSVLSQ